MRARKIKGGSIKKARLNIDFEEWIEFMQTQWQWFIKQGIEQVQDVMFEECKEMSLTRFRR